MMDIEQLVSAASGFTKDRGDQLKVASVDFVNDLGEAAPAPGLMSVLMAQAGSLINSLALVVVAVVVILFGFKPAIRMIVSQAPKAVAAAPGVAAVEATSAPALGAPASSSGRRGQRQPDRGCHQADESLAAEAARADRRV